MPHHGHGQFGIRDQPAYLAHRVAYLIYHGSLDNSLEILHKCGNGACVRKEHLQQGTRSENSQDSWRARKANTVIRPDSNHVPLCRPKPQTVEERFWSFVDKSPGHGPNGDCWIWHGGKRKGHGAFTPRKGEMWCAHRFSYFLAHGHIDQSLLVLHSCDNRPCVNPAHLRQGTQADNIRDMHKRGREASGDKHGSKTHPESRPRGEQCSYAKLTAEIVREIRSDAASGVSHAELARRYGISRPMVIFIVQRKQWAHVV
jgi:hypothetical protein